VYDDRVFALSAMMASVLVYNLPETVKERKPRFRCSDASNTLTISVRQQFALPALLPCRSKSARNRARVRRLRSRLALRWVAIWNRRRGWNSSHPTCNIQGVPCNNLHRHGTAGGRH
jgi:hypothetical protein